MRRVVVTGLGMVSPLAANVEESWRRLIAGRSAAARITSFEVADIPCQIACQVKRGDGADATFNPDAFMEPKEQRKVDDFIMYGVAAASQALADAKWAPTAYEDQIATGVMIGSGVGGLERINQAAFVVRDRGPRRLSPFFLPGLLINLASGYV